MRAADADNHLAVAAAGWPPLLRYFNTGRSGDASHTNTAKSAAITRQAGDMH